MILSIALSVTLAQAGGCTKDTDCKGDRICEAGVCVSPAQPPPSPTAAPPLETPPPPAPPPEATAADAAAPAGEFPRVVRREGQVCVQTLEADGRVAESCRAESPAPKRLRAVSTPAAESPPALVEQRSESPAARVVADLQLHGGMLVGIAGNSAGVLGDVGATAAVGGRFGSGVGLAALGSLELGAGSSTIVVGTLGLALRVGDRTHATFAAGPSVIAYLPGGAGLAGSFVVDSLFAITRAFGISLHSALHFHALGVVVTFGAGVGFGAL